MAHGWKFERLAGTFGVLAATASAAVSAAVRLIVSIRYVGVLPDQGLLLFLSFEASSALVIAVGVFAFWTSTRPDRDPAHRRMAIIASWLGVGVGALRIVSYAVETSPESLSLLWLLLAQETTQTLLPIGSCVFLAISYTGPPLGLGEPGALRLGSRWTWMIAAPALGINIAILWPGYAEFPEGSAVAALAVGLLYGLMRRRHPLPGAASWAAATWPLIALLIPSYALNIAVAAGVDYGVDRLGIATAVAVAILAGVVVAHRVGRRTGHGGHDMRASHGTGL